MVDKYGAINGNFSYMCKPLHLHSTMNEFTRIFFGVTLQSRVYADMVQVSISPYTRGQDVLSINKNDYRHNIKGNFSENTGILHMIHEGGGDLTKDDWGTILSYPTYKLNINNFNPRSCSAFTKGRYTPTITMQMIDRYGRPSNAVSRKLNVKTAVLVYTADRPVKVTNRAAYTAVEVKQNFFDPIFDKVNATVVR